MCRSFIKNPEEQPRCLDCDRPLPQHAHSTLCTYCKKYEMDFQRRLEASLAPSPGPSLTNEATVSATALHQAA